MRASQLRQSPRMSAGAGVPPSGEDYTPRAGGRHLAPRSGLTKRNSSGPEGGAGASKACPPIRASPADEPLAMPHRRPRETGLPTKPCAVCGRAITWRKKWERDWDQITLCSDACRRGKLTDTDRSLEAAILRLLRARAGGATICPSEAAREVFGTLWEPEMERARRAARRLVAQGGVVITQRGSVVDPSTAKGPIRIKLA